MLQRPDEILANLPYSTPFTVRQANAQQVQPQISPIITLGQQIAQGLAAPGQMKAQLLQQMAEKKAEIDKLTAEAQKEEAKDKRAAMVELAKTLLSGQNQLAVAKLYASRQRGGGGGDEKKPAKWAIDYLYGATGSRALASRMSAYGVDSRVSDDGNNLTYTYKKDVSEADATVIANAMNTYNDVIAAAGQADSQEIANRAIADLRRQRDELATQGNKTITIGRRAIGDVLVALAQFKTSNAIGKRLNANAGLIESPEQQAERVAVQQAQAEEDAALRDEFARGLPSAENMFGAGRVDAGGISEADIQDAMRMYGVNRKAAIEALSR